jgi:hypothetical protein
MIIGDTPAQLGQIEAADAMMIDGRVVTRDDYRALVAQLGELSKLHSDLTNADMVFDDGEHSGYLITTEQINEMEHLLSMPASCLAQVRAEAGRDGYVWGFLCALGDPDEHDKQAAEHNANIYAKSVHERIRLGGAS